MLDGNKINSIVSTDAQIKITDHHKDLAKHEALEEMMTFANINNIKLINDCHAPKFAGLFGTAHPIVATTEIKTSLFSSSVSKHDIKPKLKKYDEAVKRKRFAIRRVAKRTMKTRSMTAAMLTGRVLRTRRFVKAANHESRWI